MLPIAGQTAEPIFCGRLRVAGECFKFYFQIFFSRANLIEVFSFIIGMKYIASII